jgi:hypothetical protein
MILECDAKNRKNLHAKALAQCNILNGLTTH